MGVLLSIIMGVIPAFVYALILYWLDRYEKEPIVLLGVVFVWGAVVAAGGAYILNTIFGVGVYIFTGSEAASNLATGSISAPLVEESLKGLAVLIVFFVFRKEFDNLLDGVVYAGIAALGFAATENSIYIYRGYVDGGFGGLIFLSFIRNILVGWQHPFYTAFIGIGLAIARANKNTFIKLFAPFVGWGLAVFTHAFHNTVAAFIQSLGGLALSTLVDWTGWFFMFCLIIWFIYRERNFLKVYLREEVDLGNITAAQYATAQSALKVSLARVNAITSGKMRPTYRFYQQTAELAHKKRQLEKMGDQTAISEIEKIRRELLALSTRAVTK